MRAGADAVKPGNNPALVIMHVARRVAAGGGQATFTGLGIDGKQTPPRTGATLWGFGRARADLRQGRRRRTPVRTIAHMDGPCPRRCTRGGGPSRAARGLVLPAAGTTLALGGCSAGIDAGMPWLLVALALLATAAGSFVIGRLRGQRHSDAELRAAHRETQRLAELQDAWSWHTDAAHRLLRLHPPAGAAAAEWQRSAAPGGTLWERFESAVPGDVAGLRARLESQVPFHELRVRQTADTSVWLLRATPRFDDAGRFSGYAGTARPTAEHDALRADQGALLALLAALETPALLASGDGTAAGWAARHGNAAAWQLLDIDSPQQPPDWGVVLSRLPPAVREAIAAAPADANSEAEGWLLRRFSTEAGPQLLLLGAPLAEADAGGGGEGASFGFTVSHDLRAPIRVVEGFTRIVKEDYGRLLDRVGNDHLDRVLGAAARMNHMIDALLTLAKLSQQPLALQPVNLSQLAHYVVDELRRSAPERDADISIEAGLQVRGDPTLLRLVLENLIGNAWKYTARCQKAHIVFATEALEGKRTFVVRDNGAGFDMRSADRLFGLFQRLHSANDFPGSGVGLASVKRIVRRHGGDVWADAEPGRGAAFHFTLRD
jgi:signal transduction histidine kinase